MVQGGGGVCAGVGGKLIMKKCPSCAFPLDKGIDFCECGWQQNRGGHKRYTPYAADSAEFCNQSARSRMQYLKDIGGYGGYSDKD